MVCIYCQAKTAVINSRLNKRNNAVWRRRKCLSCGSIFTTRENAEFETAILVESAAHEIIPFSRDKLLLSVYNSCQHRTGALEESGDLVDTIIGLLLQHVENGAVKAPLIGQITRQTLMRFDEAASVHYAAFHRFKD